MAKVEETYEWYMKKAKRKWNRGRTMKHALSLVTR